MYVCIYELHRPLAQTLYTTVKAMASSTLSIIVLYTGQIATVIKYTVTRVRRVGNLPFLKLEQYSRDRATFRKAAWRNTSSVSYAFPKAR